MRSGSFFDFEEPKFYMLKTRNSTRICRRFRTLNSGSLHDVGGILTIVDFEFRKEVILAQRVVVVYGIILL